jgi:hypothetical protein
MGLPAAHEIAGTTTRPHGVTSEENAMCVEGIKNNETWTTKNGSTVVIRKTRNGYTGTVIKSKDRAYPVGCQVAYKSKMGHVLCDGHNDGTCELHPLDTAEFLDCAINAEGLINEAVTEAESKRRELLALI